MDALIVLLEAGVLVVAGFLLKYAWGARTGRLQAWGRTTYIRFYPNPGFSVALGSRRVALSVMGGLEVYRLLPHLGIWQRVYAIGSRRIRNAGG